MGQVSRFIEFKVGDGARTKFWLDIWCGEASLKDFFLELYHIAQDLNAFVADHLKFHNASIHWELNFIRSVHDWELESISAFLDLLYSVSVREHGEDKLCWKPAGSKGFEVRSYNRALSPSRAMSFPWKSIW